MKLEVTHKEIVSGLTQFLASQGITGFDPKTCQVTFSTKRGTGELSAVLDTDPAPEAPVEEKPVKEKPAATAPATTATPAATEAPQTEAPAEPEAQTEAPATEPAAAASDDDNLFD